MGPANNICNPMHMVQHKQLGLLNLHITSISVCWVSVLSRPLAEVITHNMACLSWRSVVSPSWEMTANSASTRDANIDAFFAGWVGVGDGWVLGVVGGGGGR